MLQEMAARAGLFCAPAGLLRREETLLKEKLPFPAYPHREAGSPVQDTAFPASVYSECTVFGLVNKEVQTGAKVPSDPESHCVWGGSLCGRHSLGVGPSSRPWVLVEHLSATALLALGM